MPLQIGQLLSGNEDPNKKKQQQQQGLVGIAGGALPGSPEEGAGLDFANAFGAPIQRTPIQAAGPIRDTSGLMFNPEFAQRDTAIQRQMADLGLVKQQNVQSVGQEYERNLSKAQLMQQQARKKLMERMSGQGILQSGIHGQQQGELNAAHQSYLDDLGYLKAQGLAGVESDYATRMNQLALQREGLFGEQQQVEEQRRLAAAQQEAERKAREDAAAQQAALLAALQTPPPVQAFPEAAQQYSAPSFSGGGYQGYTPQQPNWGAPAAKFDDIVNWANQMRSNYGGNREAFNADVTRLLESDPNWSGSMQNAMGTYYGGAQGIGDVLNWLWFPQAPRLNSGIWSRAKRAITDPMSQQYAAAGVL